MHKKKQIRKQGITYLSSDIHFINASVMSCVRCRKYWRTLRSPLWLCYHLWIIYVTNAHWYLLFVVIAIPLFP